MFFSELIEKHTAFTTGFPSLDDMLAGGLRRGSIISFMGVTGCGKTRMIETITNHIKEKYGLDVVLDKNFDPDDDAVIIDPRTKEVSSYSLRIPYSIEKTFDRFRTRSARLRMLSAEVHHKKQIALIPHNVRRSYYSFEADLKEPISYGAGTLSYYSSAIVNLERNADVPESTATIVKNRWGGSRGKFKVKFKPFEGQVVCEENDEK